MKREVVSGWSRSSSRLDHLESRLLRGAGRRRRSSGPDCACRRHAARAAACRAVHRASCEECRSALRRRVVPDTLMRAKRPSQGARDRGAERGFPGSRRTDETQRGSGRSGLSCLTARCSRTRSLTLFNPRCSRSSDAFDLIEEGVLGAGGLPRQRPEPLEVGADLSRFGTPGRKAAQAVHLPLGLAGDIDRQGARGRG